MPVQLPQASPLVIVTLLVITLVSAGVFYILVMRWTTRRQWTSLAEWAQKRRMKRIDANSTASLISSLAHANPRVRLEFGDKTVSVVQFDVMEDAQQFNVLIRKLGSGRECAPAGLRPASLPMGQSVIDLFSLSPFHTLANDRFSVLAVDAKSAARLASSSARALLPPDVGLMLHDGVLMLDFSARPFDPVELDRMVSVSEQISAIC